MRGRRKETLLLLLALLCFGASAAIHIKAAMAQVLLEHAWQKTLSSGAPRKAWPWADTWPVGKIRIPKLDKSLIVLEGASGEAMAFGPARVAGSAHQPAHGVTVVGGHRDTHLSFLQDLQRGDVIEWQDRTGQYHRFTWSYHLIANANSDKLALSHTEQALVLITCYPFNAAQTGGPMRFVMLATPDTRTREVTAAERPQTDNGTGIRGLFL